MREDARHVARTCSRNVGQDSLFASRNMKANFEKKKVTIENTTLSRVSRTNYDSSAS